MNEIIESLNLLTKQIEDSKKKKNILFGRSEEQMNALKELGFPSTLKAKEALKTQQAEVSKLEIKIEEKYAVLKNNYEWE